MTPNTRVAVVLAAGRGERLNQFSDVPKPLVPVDGVPLLFRNIACLKRAGVEEIIVVVGHRAEEIRTALRGDEAIRFVENPEWEKSSGLSLLAARDAVAERPFFLTMADHIYSPDVLHGLQAYTPNGHSHLAVDPNVSRVYDQENQIKVQLKDEFVVRMGRSLSHGEAVDTRVALLSKSIFNALEGLDNPRVTDGFRVLAERRELLGHDIGEALWQDIDTPETLRHAEWLLHMYGEDLVSVPRPQPGPHIANPERTLAYVDGILKENAPNHYVLFNPGPVVTSARVKSALVHHDVCHRDDTFSVLLAGLRKKLRTVFGGGPEHEVLLFTGSGTSGMEASISSSVPDDKKLLIVANGAFGERFEEIAQLHKMNHLVLRYEWGELVRPEDVETLLAADPDIAAVVMTHHETSVGLLNPIREVGALCRRYDRLFLVDAVASLGGEYISVIDDQIDICFSSANKALHAISGVAMVCVNKRAWSRIEQVDPRVYYLDLKRYRRYEVGKEQTPFTPAVSGFYALDAAVDEYLDSDRQETYRRRNQWIRQEMKSMGFGFFTQTGHESHTILTPTVPEGIRFPVLYDAMKKRGFIIYGCKPPLEDRFFQVANMGELTDEQIAGFLGTLRLVLAELRRAKREAQPGMGVVARAADRTASARARTRL